MQYLNNNTHPQSISIYNAAIKTKNKSCYVCCHTLGKEEEEKEGGGQTDLRGPFELRGRLKEPALINAGGSNLDVLEDKR